MFNTEYMINGINNVEDFFFTKVKTSSFFIAVNGRDITPDIKKKKAYETNISNFVSAVVVMSAQKPLGLWQYLC